MTLELVLTLCCCSYAAWATLRYLEHRQLWTWRLWLSQVFPLVTFTLLSTVAAMSLLWHIHTQANLSHDMRMLTLAGTLVAIVALFSRMFLPLMNSRSYVKVRWKAWTGPSRTGIPYQFVRYLGDEQDWSDMLASCGNVQCNPVETGLGILSPFDHAIAEDATDILKARARSDEEADEVWVPKSDAKASVYQPVEQDHPVSLLWGRNLGFKPRCSRGVISIPRNLLSYWPELGDGIDGRPLCLAHGILARNKGLAPQSLVCNLQLKGSYRLFEENSAFWPRPAKTYRSLYHAAMSGSYSGLGEVYVTAATELALLLADVGYNLISDWLEGTMEHQDLKLNNEIAELGGSVEELKTLYRGSYAAMLVSLSLHRIGVRVRPELAVFKALWRHEGLAPPPQWLTVDSMVRRVRQETRALGDSGAKLVQAII